MLQIIFFCISYLFLSNYINYIGPYQLAEKLLFWKDKNSSQVSDLGHFLKHGYVQSEEEKKEEDEEFERLKLKLGKA